MSCQECKQRCYPEDPAKPFRAATGYLAPLCNSCNHVPEETEPSPSARVPRYNDRVQQLEAGFLHLQKRLNQKKDPPLKQLQQDRLVDFVPEL